MKRKTELFSHTDTSTVTNNENGTLKTVKLFFQVNYLIARAERLWKLIRFYQETLKSHKYLLLFPKRSERTEEFFRPENQWSGPLVTTQL